MTVDDVLSLAIDPVTPAILYAGTYGGGVFRSANGGGSWTAINTGLTGTNVYDLAIDPTTPTTLYAVMSGDGVYRSTNSGGNWTAINTGLAGLFINDLAIDPVTPLTIYAATSGGVYRTVDGGISWSAFNDGLADTSVNALAIDPAMPSIVYAGTRGAGVVSLQQSIPGIFDLTSPANASYTTTTVTLTWEASSHAATYEFCVDTVNNNSCDSTWSLAGYSTHFGIEGLGNNDTYYWQVRAVNAAGITYANGSTWWSFTARHPTFADVPVDHSLWQYIEAFYASGITTGCGISPLIYCPEQNVTRAAMAVFLLRAKYGASYAPPPATHTFADLPVTGKEWQEAWVDQFYLEGITTGCGVSPLIYCPENPVTRAAMAVFILRALEGSSYTPPAASHYFADLPVAGKEWMEPWVDEFYRRGITTGCGTGPLIYCPEDAVKRQAMAAFIVRAFDLPLP
jgi:hypothetical protein